MNVYIVQNPNKNPAFISPQSDLPPSYSKGNKRCLSSVVFYYRLYNIIYYLVCLNLATKDSSANSNKNPPNYKTLDIKNLKEDSNL